MEPFIGLFIYLGLVLMFTRGIRDEHKRRACQAVFGGFGLFLLLALRAWTCGQDLLYEDKGTGYIYNFIRFSELGFNDLSNLSDSYEYGFKLIGWFTGQLTNNPQIYLAIVAALEVGLIGYTFYKQSPNIVFSYIVFACLGLYAFSFSGLRQALGFSFTFFAFNFINEKKPYKFILCVLIGFFMHKSSLIFLPALLFRNRKLPLSRALLCLVLILCFLPLLMPIIQYFAVLIYGHEKYSSYGGGAINLYILFNLLFLMSYLFKQVKEEDQVKMDLIRWMVVLAIFLQSSGILSSGALARIAYSYSIFFSLLIPMTFSSASNSNRKMLGTIVALLLIGFFIYTMKDGYLNIVPYRFFWEELHLY